MGDLNVRRVGLIVTGDLNILPSQLRLHELAGREPRRRVRERAAGVPTDGVDGPALWAWLLPKAAGFCLLPRTPFCKHLTVPRMCDIEG